MIISNSVKVKMEGKSFNYYKDKGYLFEWREVVDIKLEDLLPGSNSKVDVSCDICGFIKNIIYKSYIRNINRSGYYSCQSCSPIKRVKTCIEKYGVDIPTKLDIIKEKTKKTSLEKYNVDSYSKTLECKEKVKNTSIERYGSYYIGSDDYRSKQIEIIEKTKKTKIKKGIQLSDETLGKFKLYKKTCRNITNRNKKELYENWDGYDYYDDEYIKCNYSLNSGDKLYPTIDHKISIWYGFNNNIDENIIGSIDNLCMTKRSINSTKNKNNEYE